MRQRKWGAVAGKAGPYRMTSKGTGNSQQQIPFGNDKQERQQQIPFGNDKQERQQQIPFGNDKQEA